MKPQTGAFLEKARELLNEADQIRRIGLNEAAGRSAYLAGMHAAQSLIFESTGKIVKSQKGVHLELARLTKGDPRFDADLRAFLGRAYHLKDIADYQTGSSAHVSPESAGKAIATARRFIDCIAAILPQKNPTNEPNQ